MKVIVRLSIPLEIENTIDLEDKTLYKEWMDNAISQMILHPHATYIMLKEITPDDLEPKVPDEESKPLPGLSPEFEKQISGLLEGLDF